MKLFRDDDPYISKRKWKQIFLAMSIMVLVLYIVAMIFSLCGSSYFILNYQNEQMDRIEAWFRERDIMAIITFAYTTIESTILITFTLKKKPKWYHPLAFYVVLILLSFIIRNDYPILFTLSQIVLSIIFIFIDCKVTNHKIEWKYILFSLIRFAIATLIGFILQAMIYVIKDGDWSFTNHVMNLSAIFCYTLEYDIALSVLLFTTALYIDREKGDNEQWVTESHLGGSSQVSKTQLPESNTKKNLTKAQKNKIRLFYAKVYFIQLGTFLLVMVLPFLLGKVFEFLVMYLAFCVTRSILGFKYSLHYKKESLCATVGVVVFGILSLVVPFFTVVVIIAIVLGTGLAILLHLSYKYRGFYLFNKISRPDKFAEIYVLFDEDLSEHHVRAICMHRGLDKEQTNLIVEFSQGNKKSYIAKRFNYSEKTIERKLNEIIDILKERA